MITILYQDHVSLSAMYTENFFSLDLSVDLQDSETYGDLRWVPHITTSSSDCVQSVIL